MLAFWFLHAWLAFAAAPIGTAVVLVHLLRPGRHKPVRWAAMQFLQAAVAESRRRLRMERWLLLLLRALLLMLLALLLARPIRQSLGALFGTEGGAALLVIVDNGLAMEAPSTLPPHTLLEEALEAAIPAVHGWHGPVAVMPALGQDKAQWLSRPDFAESILNQTHPTAGRADWQTVLTTARRVLPESGVGASHRTVLLLTSLTRGNWPESDNLASPLADLAGAANRVILADMQPARRDNVAIADLAVDPAFAGRDLPAQALVRVVNYGPQPAADLKVVWSLDGRELRQDEAGTIAPGSQARLAADIPAFGTGQHNVEVHLSGPADALAADDQRWASLLMPKDLRIVLVEPDAAAPAASRASLFVAAALESAMRQSSVPIRLDRVSPGELGAAFFEPADAVLLCDVGGLAAEDWQHLAEQVKQGCGLLAWFGPRSLSQPYTSQARDLLAGLPRTTEIAGEGQDWNIRFSEPIRPALLDLAQTSGGDSSLGSIRQLLAVEPASGTQVLAATAAGQPVALLRRIGQGASVLVTTSPDLAWNNMASRPTFPAFVLGLLREVLAPNGRKLQVTCGQPIRLPLSGGASGSVGRWIKPDGSAEAARISLDGGRLEAVLPLAAMPGPYQLESSAASRTIFASADPQAGDLALVADAGRRRLAMPRLTVVASSNLAATLAGSVSDEWTGPLAYVLLAILLAELLLTGWFTRARVS